MKIHIIISAILMSIFSLGIGCADSAGDYGKIVTFGKGTAIKFPDFSITYTGETSKTSEFPNGNKFTFKYKNFDVSNGSETKTIQWTAGTGEIGPIMFDF